MLQLRDVSFGYENSQAVDRINASFDRTQLIALTGPNGSGKSTLLKLIARVLAPHAGEIAFDSKGNLIVQDHTYNKVWVINYDRDPVWLRALKGPPGAGASSASW